MKNSQTWVEAERSVRRKQGFRAHALAYAMANSAMIAGWATSGGRFWPLGRRAQYVKNIQASSKVRVRVRRGVRQQWRTGTAHVLADDDSRARQRAICRGKPGRKLNAFALAALGTDMLTIRIDLEQPRPADAR